MFFQIDITPKEKKAKESCQQSQINNNYTLLLAPFQPPTRIKLDTRINTSVECKLTIINSNNRSLKVCMTKVPPEERFISLSTKEWLIESESNVILTIIWEPREGGTWRDILQLTDSRHIKYDIPITLTCIDPNKVVKSKQGIKIKQRNVLAPKVSSASNIKKNDLLKYKPSVSHNNKNVIIKKPIQTDKENIYNNVSINWMLEQAKINKQNTKKSPPKQSLDFSKYLDSSVFKFTPINSKFKSPEFKALRDTTALNSQPSNNKISDFNQLRKETYITVPKYLNVPPDIEDSDDNDQFDDSLSPKQEENIPDKPPSDISRILSDIKFTPYKAPEKSDENMKFSPNYCSTDKKPIRNNSFNNDTMCNNETFDINFEGNNTYELPLSPKSTRNCFPLKPTCLATTFDKTNIDTDLLNSFSTNGHVRCSNQFSKSQVDCGSARDCLEADLWVKSRNTSLSPISRNMHSTLDSIKEEDIHNSDDMENTDREGKTYTNQLQQLVGVSIEISPPKRYTKNKSPIRKISPTKKGKIIKEKCSLETMKPRKKVQINNIIKSDRSIPIPGVRITKLSLAGLHKNKDKRNCLQKQSKEVSVKLHDPNDFLTMFCNPDPFSATMTHDPFLCSTLYYDDKWMFLQELELKKWLNLLMTPPEHLTTDIESTSIDIGKVWQSCRLKEDVTLAETKESISARYHTNTRLNSLRKAACVMFRKPEVITALSQITVGIEKEILLVRPDKDLHRDIGLQKIILELFISYNPLWLRIGLETIYGETIPLQSNNDLIGLSRFLLNRFFSDPFLIKTHSAYLHPNIRLNSFQPLMNKFILKKFLFLVYFLDYSKRNKLIGHDPCLFHKKALIKDSRSILLTFSRELLSGIGDITKVLRNYNYVVSHKQTYLDEYDYAVINLCTDLRDGVRLCRVMELITGKRCLTCRCRVPAISRLQKVHNVNIALATLNEVGYTITGDIDAKSIADGHKEKTLSLLWQIIYKFQAPRFEKAAKILQRWWRSKLWYVYIKNMLKNWRYNAASTIQRAWKCYLARQEFKKLKEEYTSKMHKKIKAATVIQLHWRRKMEVRNQQKLYQLIRISATKIQKWWKNIQSTKPYVSAFKRKQQIIIQIQNSWRARQLMKVERNRFLKLKSNVITIQVLWRARSLALQVYKDYHQTRNVIIFIQMKWRAKLAMKKERKYFLQNLRAIKLIQNWWRQYLILSRQRNHFIALKNSVRKIEKIWIKKNTISEERKRFLTIKKSASIIQKAWRSHNAVKEDVFIYKRKKEACLKIQSWWKSRIARKKFEKERSSCIVLQNWWRSVILSKKERSEFLMLKGAAVIFQKNWKMRLAKINYKRKRTAILKIQYWYQSLIISRMIRIEYLKIKSSVRIIEMAWLALKVGRSTKIEFVEKKKAAIIIQKKWRSFKLMIDMRKNYLKMRSSAIKIQSWWKMILQNKCYKELVKNNTAAIVLQRRWRALKKGKQAQDIYSKYRFSIILIQRKWRATSTAILERNTFLIKRKSAIMIQKYWRRFVTLRKYKRMKNAVKMIENWRIHNLLGKQIHSEFLKIKTSIIQIQCLWRTKLQMRQFKKQRDSAIIIQKYYRCYIALKDYQKQQRAVIIIQQWRRQLIVARKTRHKFLKLKASAVKIQNLWRTKQQVIKYKKYRESAITIQKNWKRTVTMREYNKKKVAVLFIENWRKHLLYGRRVRMEFLQLKTSVLKLQMLLRVKIQVKEFRRRREAAMKLQRFWRSIIKMRKCKLMYNKQKNAAIILQRHYRAKQISKQVRINYRHTILSIIKIQNWWKSILYSRKLQVLRETRKYAVSVVENWWIYALEKRRVLKKKRIEWAKKHKAATKIQATWRGFTVRQTASKKLVSLRERSKEAAKAAVPSATLAVRLQENIEIFKDASSIGQLSVCLSSLDVITRLSPNACFNVCQLNLVSKLYDILTRANRSLPWLDVCLKDISILLTLAKFKPTVEFVLKEEYIELLARLLTISVDKKQDLFLHTATLIWILTENYNYAEAMRSCSRTKYLLTTLHSSLLKKTLKVLPVAVKLKDALPSPKPDWGLRHKRPRTFNSVTQAIISITSRLKILNINQTDIQRSFNFSV